MITSEELKEILHYDKNTGVFTWKKSKCHLIKPGDIAGTFMKGYVRISIGSKIYLAHRLAWLYVHGVWPENQIDHKNNIRHDNRIINLRPVSNSGNQQNLKKARKHSSSGVLGVSVVKNGFVARIRTSEGKKHLGTFRKIEDAEAAYIEEKRKIHPSGLI